MTHDSLHDGEEL